MLQRHLVLVAVLVACAGTARAFQGPPNLPGGHTKPKGGGGGGGSPGGGRYGGPGDTIPPGQGPGASSGSTAGSDRPSPARAAAGPLIPVATHMPGMPTPISLSTESDDGWVLWWEYNKMEFLRPNRLGMWGFPATGADAESELRARMSLARGGLEPVLVQALSDPDLTIRSAAAIALSRVAGDDSVEPLLKVLSDPSADVREHAILALGASGSLKAVQPLLSIARYGAPVEGARERVTPYACPLAIVALALGRRSGLDSKIDAMVASIVRGHAVSDRESVVAAALFYQSLAPCPEFARLALDVVDDATLSPAVRCRAVESLRHSSDSGVPDRLVKLLSCPRLDLRRSAALALGSIQDSGAVPALQAAFASEAEPLTRGFILISIGRQGGDKARQTLLRLAKDGESGMRKWVALALGIAARTSDDPELAKAIRELAAREKSQDDVPAFWLASALAGDESARESISEGLVRAPDPTQRMYAATSLALLGGEASEKTLRAHLDVDDSALVRASIASALGYLGRPEDAQALAATMQKLREPGLQGLTATALSFHGSVAAFQLLSEISRSTSGTTVRRAAALEGLGMMLAPAEPLLFAEVSRQANYTVFPEWVKGLFQLTL